MKLAGKNRSTRVRQKIRNLIECLETFNKNSILDIYFEHWSLSGSKPFWHSDNVTERFFKTFMAVNLPVNNVLL